MKKGWEYKTFEECIVKVPKQKQIKSKDYLLSGNYPVVSQEQELISGYYNDESYVFKHSKPVVVFGDHTKNIKYIDFDFVVGADGTQILMTIEKIETKFFYYTLKSIKLDNLGYARHYKLLKKMEIGFPNIAEQRRIVSYLDSSFDLIDKIKENASKSLSEAKSLFQSALAEAMEPKEGWEEKTLGEIATDMYRGSGIKRDQISQIGFPCVRYGEIYTTYNYSFNECVSHTNESLINPKKYFDKGDILFAITGESVEDIGKCIAYTGKERCLCGGDIVVMKHNQYPQFLAYALSTKEAIRQKGLGKVKLKVVHTNVPALKSIKIYLPTDIKTQKQIVSRLDSLSSKVRAIEEKYQKMIAECDALKQAMLREVFE